MNESLSNSLGSARSSVNDAVAEATSHEGGRFGFVRENPIGLALVGLALGFLAGSVLPVSDAERERLGPIGDRVVDQAEGVTHDLVEAGKSVVADTVAGMITSARTSAQTHGNEVAENVVRRAGDSAS